MKKASFSAMSGSKAGRRSMALGIAALMILLVSGSPALAELRIGAGEADITPDPVRMRVTKGGYAHFLGQRAEGVHDPLSAKALVFESQGERAALVAIDLVEVSRDLREAVLERLAGTVYHRGNVFICATHTHAAPGAVEKNIVAAMAFGPYSRRVVDVIAGGIALAIKDADSRLRPAVLSTASGQAPGLVRNRRGPSYNYHSRRFSSPYDPKTEPPADNTITVLRANRRDGKPIAILVQFSAHATALGPANNLLSADWPGVLRREIEARYPGALVLYVNGAEGDQAPDITGIPDDYEAMELFGKRAASAAAPLIERARPVHAEPLAYRIEWLDVGLPAHLGMLRIPSCLVRLWMKKMPFSVIRLGDLVLLGAPFEATGAVGREVKEAAGAAGYAHPVYVGLMNQYCGYATTPGEYRAGGYEARYSLFGERARDLIVGELAGLARVLRERSGPREARGTSPGLGRHIQGNEKACRGAGGNVERILSSSPPEKETNRLDIRLPAPDPLGPDDATLYSLYRKGLITRHLTRNGRVLPTVALEKIDPHSYDKSGYVKVLHSDGTLIRLPIGNVRYSEEKTSGKKNAEKIMWAPVIAPMKDPGPGNDGYYVVSGNSENPLYYASGLALATFSLEHLHRVSPQSIHYARRIVRFFLASEMWEGSGYIVRKTGFFNSRRNIDGGPVIQGASLEELSGLMLGIMYYLKAEDPREPLYAEAVRLRDNVLNRVSSGSLWTPYEHPFMNSSHYPSYWVKHFEFPFYAVKEYRSWLSKHLYISLLTAGTGRTRSLLFRDKFEDYMIFLTSMIPVLDGALPDEEKEWFAEVFMRDVIKAAKTAGPDRDALWDNQYLAVVALLANKYLNEQRDSIVISDKLKAIWGGSMDVYERMVRIAGLPVPTPAGRHWQHNLPLEAVSGDSAGWKDHNPDHGIGSFFIWRYENQQFYWLNARSRWLGDFPGFVSFPAAGLRISGPINDKEYKEQSLKAYPIEGYLQKELMGARGSDDNQVEGAGLDLLFIRMLLTHVNPERYPAPRLADRDRIYPVLPYDGAEPLSPQRMHYAYRSVSSRDADCGPFAVSGDRDEALRIVKTGADAEVSGDFIVAYASADKKLVLRRGFVSDGSAPGGKAGIFLDRSGVTGKRFDTVALASAGDPGGDKLLIAAERAEGDISLDPFGGCFLQRGHWLRLSLWKLAASSEGRGTNPVLLDSWEPDSSSCNAVLDVDAALLGNKYAAVLSRTGDGRDMASMFSVEHDHLNLVSEALINDKAAWNKMRIKSVNDDVLIYSRHDETGWKLTSLKWNGRKLQRISESPGQRGKLLDMTVVAHPDKRYVVVAVNQDNYLALYSYEALRDGALIYRGEFHTEDGEQYLLDREAGYERASLSSFPWDGKAGFVIAGKGVAREVRDLAGRWRKSAKGLKIVYGYILTDGRPAIETSAVMGSGDPAELRMLDVTGHMSDGTFHGVLSAHQVKDDDCLTGAWCDDRLQLTFWHYRDPYRDHRWQKDTP